MKIKGIRNLQLAVIILQVIALLVAVAITIGQASVKQIMGYHDDLLDVFAVPVGSFLKMIPMLILYGVGMFITTQFVVANKKVRAGVLLGVACLLQFGSQFTSLIALIIARTQGANALATYSVMESIVTQYTNPLTVVAFALFCFACGGYVGAKENATDTNF